MTLSSKYDGKCKDCGTTHVIGDAIDQNNNGHWCKNGTNCQGAIEMSSTTPKSYPDKPATSEPTPEELINTAKSLLKLHPDKIDPDKIDGAIDEYVERIHSIATRQAIIQLIRTAAINKVMDTAKIQHPSRMAYIHEVMEEIRN